MKHTNLEEYRSSGTLKDIQTGAPFNAFNRGTHIRHAQLGTWWERALAILSMVFVLLTLINIALRHLLF
jgi:hypothetical protein